MATDMERPQFSYCFRNWMFQQEDDLEQPLQALKQGVHDSKKLRLAIEMGIKHYEQYHEKRMAYARRNTSSFFSPTWCSSFENSYLWVAGCRPSLFIRLLCTLTGSSIETHLAEFLQGVRKGHLGELSPDQLVRVDDLQRRTIRSEDKLSSEVASIQGDMADKMVVEKALDQGGRQCDSDVHAVLDSLESSWLGILEKADNLRLNTLKEMINILTPLQAVEYLIASKMLYLSIRQWCSTRDN